MRAGLALFDGRSGEAEALAGCALERSRLQGHVASTPTGLAVLTQSSTVTAQWICRPGTWTKAHEGCACGTTRSIGSLWPLATIQA